MAKRATTEEFKEKILKKYKGKVEILSDYNGGTQPINFVYHCEKHGDIYKTMNAKNISSNKTFQPCDECMKENKRSNYRKPNELYDEMKMYIESKYGKLLTEKWTRSKDKYLIKCNNPKHPPFEVTHDSLMNSKKCWCPYCAGRKGDFNSYYKNLIELKNGKMLSDYVGSDKYISVKCNKHNWIWDIMPLNLKKGRWCPICGLPESELVIFDILREFGLNFEIQKQFDGLVGDNNDNLKFDFAIIDKKKNILLIIESDGNDHRVNTSNTKKLKLQRYDIIKDNYCKNNNINILRIPFYEGMSYNDYRDYVIKNYIEDIKKSIK